MKSIFYLDTSALNYFADHVNQFDALSSLKQHLGFEFHISSIGLWEILLNSNAKRRDWLIYWGQFNCSNKLLKSPSEIIINYIEAGCPEKGRKLFFDAPFTGQEIGTTWENIHGKIDRTIPVDISALKERSKSIRLLSKSLKSIIESMCDKSSKNYNKDPFHQSMLDVLEKLDMPIELSEESERLMKLSLIFLFFIICIGFELQNETIDIFWEKKKITDPFDRLDYLVENHSRIITRGPIIEMAKMADAQLAMKNSRSRGLMHDCFHTVYCYYSHNLITADSHFESLRDTDNHPVFDGIITTTQVESVWHRSQAILQSKNKNLNISNLLFK